MPGISAIILAAGFSRRMGGTDKLMLEYSGRTLLERAVALADSLPVCEKILVSTAERLSRLRLPPGFCPLENRNPEAGQSSSLRIGLEAASGEHYLFLTADQPLLEPEDLLPILAAARPGRIVYPEADGRPCSPALFAREFREELLSQSGDSGGRPVRLAHPEACIAVKAEKPGHFPDIDDADAYLALTGGPASFG